MDMVLCKHGRYVGTYVCRWVGGWVGWQVHVHSRLVGTCSLLGRLVGGGDPK